MRIILIVVSTMLLTSCNSGGNDKAASLKALNEQSLKCIRVLNEAENRKNAALSAGDAAAAEAFQKTMDSAAKENVRIGQQMGELEK